jgi:hypothetical protein
MRLELGAEVRVAGPEGADFSLKLGLARRAKLHMEQRRLCITTHTGVFEQFVDLMHLYGA